MKTMNKILLITLLAAIGYGSTTYAKPGDEPKDSTKTVQAEDNFSGSLELIKSIEPDHSYARANTFYGLPADIAGDNWTEFYTDGTFMGRNTLTKNIAGPLGVQNITRYGTGSTINTGLGASIDITPDDGFIRLYGVPGFIDGNGKIVENSSILGIYWEANITDHLKVSGFQEINPTGKEGAKFDYGEGNLEYILDDNVSVSYNPALFNNGEGKIVPKIEHRFTFKYTFK